MNDLTRRSPVEFESTPMHTEERHHWRVVSAYTDEGQGPWLVDLSHHSQWDLQDASLGDCKPAGIPVPQAPGQCRLQNRILISRLNRTQAVIWHLDSRRQPALPVDSGYTDISEADVALALFGPNVFTVAEKLSALDFMDPKCVAPFMLQGPFSHVPSRIAVIERQNKADGTFLLTCSRGYARDMVHALLTAGEPFGLVPAGEDRFNARLASVKDLG